MPPSAQEAAAQLQAYQAPTTDSTLETARKKYGVDELAGKVSALRGLTTNLTNSIAAVDPSVTGRTAGSLVTEGQRSALVSRERQPAVAQLGTANDSLGLATNDYNTADNNAKTYAGSLQQESKDKYDKLLQTYQIANERETSAAKMRADEAARVQAQANEDRNFAESQRQASISASAKSGAAAKASPADVKLQVSQHIAQGLASSVGKDGKVSNQTWSAALNDAVSAGFTVREFWQKYGQFVNTKYTSSYAGYGQR